MLGLGLAAAVSEASMASGPTAAGALQAMELVNDINKPNIFVHLDTHHMNIEESDCVAACKACGDKLRRAAGRGCTLQLPCEPVG